MIDDKYSCYDCGRSFSTEAALEHHREEECSQDMCRRCKKRPSSQEGRCYVCYAYSR
jgi:hypothetical protein